MRRNFNPDIGRATQFKPGNKGGPGRPRSASAMLAFEQVARSLFSGSEAAPPVTMAAFMSRRNMNRWISQKNVLHGALIHVIRQMFRGGNAGVRYAGLFLRMLQPKLGQLLEQHGIQRWELADTIKKLSTRRAEKEALAAYRSEPPPEPAQRTEKRIYNAPPRPAERAEYIPRPKRKTFSFWENLEL